jgi:hypothetical protein
MSVAEARAADLAAIRGETAPPEPVAGVEECYDGMVHGFFAMTRQLGRARVAHAEAASALRAAFFGR